MTDSRTILVVDDNEINRKVAALFLKKQAWQVDQAASGPEALSKLGAQHYACVLLDISMPGMSGLEVCKIIRADQGLNDTRVVAYTAHALSDEISTIMQAGFDAMVTKPLTSESLFAAING